MPAEPGCEPMTGGVKAAVMLLCVGRQAAGRLLARLSDDEVRLIHASARRLSRVSRADIEALVAEFTRLFGEGVPFVGTEDEVVSLLDAALPGGIAARLSPGEPAAATAAPGVWQRLAAVAGDRLADLLAGQRSQVAAAILFQAAPADAARVLPLLAPAARADIVGRMMAMRPPTAAALVLVERLLEAELFAAAPAPVAGASRGRVADIVNSLGENDVRRLVGELAERDAAEAAALRRLVFVFSDVAALADAARAVLIEAVDVEQLTLALHGTEAAFQAAVLSALSARARRMVETELRAAGQVRAADVEAARQAIARTALTLAAQGRIELAPAEAAA